uniref:Uncharacterized protein n=1 Tax=Picea sitchensis TaxID=3332 RepID=A9NLS3_PICSI|nr:unknown [Picea sitchensis]
MISGIASRAGENFLMQMNLIWSRPSLENIKGGWKDRMQSFKKKQRRKNMQGFDHLLIMLIKRILAY